MMTSALYDVFVSYADTDRAWVEGYLLDALAEAGVRCHSEAAFALGVPRLLEFERAIQQSKRTLIVLSPAYLSDGFGQFTDLLMQSFGAESGTWPVIPLIIAPMTLPPRLAMLNPLRATDLKGQRAIVERLCKEFQRPVPSAVAKPPCPYPGMVPFGEADSSRYFGREDQVRDLLERLRLHPFLAVIGPSGSGKSSLVFAGLLPALRESGLFGAGEWLVRVLRPGATPLQALAATLSNSADNLDQAMLTLLGSQPGSTRLLLVVDQFEETFALAGVEAIPFQQALLDLAEVARCFVVLTVRADFYADLMTSPLWQRVQAHRTEVVPLDTDGLRRAIVRPAEDVGVYIETALVERLVVEAAGEPGALPLIQETLVLLWERLERRCLPLRAYEALVPPRNAVGAAHDTGRTGLQVAIARRADAALADLPPAQQVIARRILMRLIQFGEGRADTRRQQPIDALGSLGDDPKQFDQTIRHLADSRLLTLSGEANTGQHNSDIRSPDAGHRPSVRVDIAHEALIGGWPTLQSWLAERRELEQTRRWLEAKAIEWMHMGERSGGLLDEAELPGAERWLHNPAAADLGYAEMLPRFVAASRAAIEAASNEKEAARQRELAQAQALVALERQGRRRLQVLVAILGALSLLAAGYIAWPYALSLAARGEMATIPAGPVVIGTNSADAYPNEQPEWHPTLPAFKIERYEVSNRQYEMCVRARVCSQPDDPIQYADPQLGDHPVVGVTAIQAAEYCRWLGRRLPTELEWERAARGPGPGRAWPWGDAALTPEIANVAIDGVTIGTQPIDSHPEGASLEGVSNLIGNVWEWTSSFKQQYANYDQTQIWDGKTLDVLARRTLIYRGGGWEDSLSRPTERPDLRGSRSVPSVGIRCASDT
jgi:formylglycine-generating enzyme required for sulfatase activity